MKLLLIAIGFVALFNQAFSVPLYPEEVVMRPFISNGIRTSASPYYAYVLFLNANNLGNFGGGAIITPRTILTAAVNVEGFTQWRIGTGSNAFNRLNIVQAASATRHPEYNGNTRANDIAVIILAQPLQISGNIFPVRLPPQNLMLPMENDAGRITGFGLMNTNQNGPSQFLNIGYKRTIGFQRCQSFFIVDTARQFCAEDVEERSNICDGDQGGPFVMSYRRTDVLVGIATLSARPCGQHSPSAYTRVSHYLQWITSVTVA